MDAGPEALPDDIELLKVALVAARAEVATARAQRSDDQALIAHLKLQIEKLNRDRYGPHSERTARLLDQLELQLEELEASATEDELAAETAAAKTATVASFTRKRPRQIRHLAERPDQQASQLVSTNPINIWWHPGHGHHRIVILSYWEVPRSPRSDLSHPPQARDHPTAHRAAVNSPLPGLLPLLQPR